MPVPVVNILMLHLSGDAFKRWGKPSGLRIVRLEHALEAVDDASRANRTAVEARDPKVHEERRKAWDGRRHRSSERDIMEALQREGALTG